MPAKILVLVKKDGLNQNLLQLALDSGDFDLSFLEPQELNENMLAQFTSLIVDDSALRCFEDVTKMLGHEARQKKIIYLSTKIQSEFKSEEYPYWTCILKPFNPSELKVMLSA